MSTPILLDCDPGIDDALAIAFAAGHPGIELIGLTTVAGNVGVDRTTANALAVSEFVGAPSVPVTAGSAGPLLRAARDARDVHGDSGLGGAVLPPPTREERPGHAVDYLIETIRAAPGKITLVATGPLTNIALAVRREPRLPGWVRDFVIMGGSAGRGNVTPAAEFNIWSDPEAAAITFGAGWTVRMIGLDVTLQALATPPVQARMSSLGALGGTLLLPALAQYHDSAAGGHPAVHDVCAVASVAEPSVFGYTPARVEVETAGRLTSGMTVTSFSPGTSDAAGAAGDSSGAAGTTGAAGTAGTVPNAEVATSIDSGAFWDLVLKTYSSLASSMERA